MNRYLSSAAALSISFASSCFLNVLVLLLSPRHDVVLHFDGPASALFVPALLNIAALAGACFLLLALLQSAVIARRIAFAALTALLPWILFHKSCALLDIVISPLSGISLSLACVALFLLLVFTPRLHHPWLRQARSALELSWRLLAAVSLLFFAETIYFGIRAHNLNRPAAIAPAMARRARNHSGRVLWIVLDELGYQQAFGNRLPGLPLPSFDELRAHSTVFTDVQPAGMYTEVVLPDLMTGIPANQISGSADGRQLTLQADRRRIPFAPNDTVFADALSLGYRNAVVGWYVPYCRLLAPVLSSCYQNGQTDLSDLFPFPAIAPNLVHPLVRFLQTFPHLFHAPPGPTPEEIDDSKLHYADFVGIDQATTRVLANSENDFILIHAPVPHPEGIWNRDTHAFAAGHSDYVDNLALADQFLGSIISTLQRRGEWDNCTIVLMGDHAWRTELLWRHSRSWRPVDEIASSGGRFDPRPAYLVKLPHQQQTATLSTPFAAIRTRALLDQLLRRRITTPDQLASFAATP